MGSLTKDEAILKLGQAIENGDVDLSVELTGQALELTDLRNTLETLQSAMRRVGVNFEEQIIYLPELYMSAQAMDACSKVLEPELAKLKGKDVSGKIVLGTVENDIHDIGKNLVKTLLVANGFEVYDVGVNCPADEFIDKMLETEADIIAMSSLLTITMPEITKVISKLHNLKLKRNVYTMIGGSPISQAFADKVGADGYASNAFGAVSVATRLMTQK